MTAVRLAVLYLVYGLVAVAFLAINMPPFQNADEGAHFLRAAQIADGGWVGRRISVITRDGSQYTTAGGLADPAIAQAIAAFDRLPFRPDARANRMMWPPSIYWSERRIFQAFPGAAVYPPFFYLPTAFGIMLGRVLDAKVVQTLVISRLLTGTAAVALGALAIALGGGAAAWPFAVLTLPMSLSLTASSSQDALLLAFSALAGSLLLQILCSPAELDGRQSVMSVAALGLIAMARPPYGALAMLPLALTKMPLRTRILGAVTVAVCVAIWSIIAAATSLTNIGASVGADPGTQLRYLSTDPVLIVKVGWSTLTQMWGVYADGFVGRLGWLDTPLPRWYHWAARGMLMAAGVAAMLRMKTEQVPPLSRVIILVGLLLSAAGIFAIQYLTFTRPGKSIVEGVQGRYFLPLALAGTALLPALTKSRRRGLQNALIFMAAAFPLLTLAVVMRTVVLRYYLQ